LLLPPAITTFYRALLAPNAFYYIKKTTKICSKWSAFASTDAFPPIFVDERETREYFLPQGAEYPSYGTENIPKNVLILEKIVKSFKLWGLCLQITAILYPHPQEL